MREIYGHNFKWQHMRHNDDGGFTVERYRARCGIRAGGYFPGRYAKVIYI